MKRGIISLAVVFAALSVAAVSAAEAVKVKPSAAFKTKTKSVAIFKDGYGFFVREGQAPLFDGWCMTDYIPKATLGTFWLQTLDDGTAVDTVRSTARNELRFENVEELVTQLNRCLGLSVRLTTADSSAEGELVRVVDGMVLIKSGKQVNVVQVDEIKAAQVLGQPLLIQVQSQKPVSSVNMRMGYLQQGISWVPMYTLDLLSPNQAKINLRATITNGIEDLEGCNIYFVVGVPNFSMKGELDPLTVHAIGSAVLRGVAPSPFPSQAFSNSRAASIADEYKYDAKPYVPIVNAPLEGLQDMYFYEKKGLDMYVGDVISTSVMSATIPYRSVFVWNVASGNKVDHYVVLNNTTALPLTTGPAMVVQNGKPVSQDELKYISPKAEGRLRLTQTSDIRTSTWENELKRLPEEKRDGWSYIPVLMDGRLLIENNRNETAEVEIAWSTAGKATEASDNALIRSHNVIEEGLNPVSDLSCTVKVGAGKKHTVSYQYIHYVRATAR